ncbi:MAG: peptidylprolyl isomerase [Actinomycetota bacterium]
MVDLVAMAKAGNEPPGTSGSQFFLVPGDGASSLPAEYAVLGRVTKGDNVLAKIEAVPTEVEGGGEQGEKSSPLQTVYILEVTIRES